MACGLWLLASGVCGPAGCAESHDRPIDGGPVSDTSFDAERHPRPRPPPELLPGEVCVPYIAAHRAAACDDEFRAMCDRWMELAANGWYGHGRCGDPRRDDSGCLAGDYCPPGEPCRCAETVTCPGNYVCVSDSPDGPRWCRRACAP